MKDYITISFKGKDYKINLTKLKAAIKYLAQTANHKVNLRSHKGIISAMEHFKLINTDFLENVNKL